MKVLICVDYSSFTEKVLEGAQIILGTRIPQPEISVLHVLDETLLSAGTGAEPQLLQGMQDNSRKINELAKKYFGSNVNYIEEYGIPRVKIDEVIQQANFNLLVLGTRGRSAVTKMLLGSETQHLLYHAQVPVLLIP